ncbi:hypothetical protein HDV03_005095 [Kappamyces sp. JEL0829]|nr:hypothetical protein HDV03_005095 [Kappamyces sp. JEL0829]
MNPSTGEARPPQPSLQELYNANPAMVEQYFRDRGLPLPQGLVKTTPPSFLQQNQLNTMQMLSQNLFAGNATFAASPGQQNLGFLGSQAQHNPAAFAPSAGMFGNPSMSPPQPQNLGLGTALTPQLQALATLQLLGGLRPQSMTQQALQYQALLGATAGRTNLLPGQLQSQLLASRSALGNAYPALASAPIRPYLFPRSTTPKQGAAKQPAHTGTPPTSSHTPIPPDEAEHLRIVKARIAQALENDHRMVTSIDVSRFKDRHDAIARLLAFHVVQFPEYPDSYKNYKRPSHEEAAAEQTQHQERLLKLKERFQAAEDLAKKSKLAALESYCASVLETEKPA